MSFFNAPHIILENVDLGETKVSIPIADIKSDTPGTTIVITGGIDGDEYTGIQTAYKLIDYYSKHTFPGRLIIAPVVNIPGFFVGTSFNPYDNKYPKYIYPGKISGSSSEKLIDWLDKKCLSQATLWIDLHSGALTETLTPFVWSFETRNKAINTITKNVLGNINCPIKIYEKSILFSKSDRLASKNCGYLVFEAGDRGHQKKEDIERMTSWVTETLKTIWNPPKTIKKTSYFKKVHFYRSPKPGLWEPLLTSGSIKKGILVGTIYSLDKEESYQVVIRESGTILWAKSALFTNTNDVVLAVACSEAT